MFDVNNIYTDSTGKRYLCDYDTSSSDIAKYIAAKYLLPIREALFSADIYAKGYTVTIDTPIENATISLANQINEHLSKSN